MILLFSNKYDSTTNYITCWLNYYNQKWERINSFKTTDYTISIDFENKKLANFIFNKREINSILFRQFPKLDFSKEIVSTSNNIKLKKEIIAHVNNEYFEFLNSFGSLFDTERMLGNPLRSELNKIYQLKLAKKNKLKIPATLISNNKKELLRFRKKFKRIIIKPLKKSFFHTIEDHSYVSYTSIVTTSLINDLNDTFFPAFFQQYIEKKIEIRSYYLNGKFYSMAIFSQSDKQTSVDFRKYNSLNPNRTVPYQLPEDYENKLINLMNDLDLNTGSIDIIVNKKGEYVFLEVNPDGQFGMVSYPCNYYLEQKVAYYLIGKTE